MTDPAETPATQAKTMTLISVKKNAYSHDAVPLTIVATEDEAKALVALIDRSGSKAVVKHVPLLRNLLRRAIRRMEDLEMNNERLAKMVRDMGGTP